MIETIDKIFLAAAAAYNAIDMFPTSASPCRPKSHEEKMRDKIATGNCGSNFVNNHTGEDVENPRARTEAEMASIRESLANMIDKSKAYNDAFPTTELGYTTGHSSYDSFVYKLYFSHKAECISIQKEVVYNNKNVIVSSWIVSIWKFKTGEEITIFSNDIMFTWLGSPYLFEKRNADGTIYYNDSWKQKSQLFAQLSKLKLPKKLESAK